MGVTVWGVYNILYIQCIFSALEDGLAHIYNRGQSVRINFEWEKQEKSFLYFYFPTSFFHRNPWASFSTVNSIMSWAEETLFGFMVLSFFINLRSEYSWSFLVGDSLVQG